MSKSSLNDLTISHFIGMMGKTKNYLKLKFRVNLVIVLVVVWFPCMGIYFVNFLILSVAKNVLFLQCFFFFGHFFG